MGKTKSVGLGAIVVMGGEREAFCSTTSRETGQEALLAEPLPCVDILGRPMVERSIERFVRADVEAISVLVQADKHCGVGPFCSAFENVKVQVVSDPGSAISQTLKDYLQNGIEHSFVISANVYAETDLLDLFYFHREARRAATRAIDCGGPLDLWVVDCAKGQSDLEQALREGQGTGASYFIREYVNRLKHPEDLRRFVSDVLRGLTAMRPPGREVKRGIWIDEGAEVHRRARIVAPAYIGRGTEIMQDTLITRCTSIEKGCCVDYGTVVEDSSILANTHIGIWLDVCHAVASGNKLLSLGRDVLVEISDPSVMRFGSSVRKEAGKAFVLSRRNEREPNEQQQIVADLQPEQTPGPEPWQLGANPIQG